MALDTATVLKSTITFLLEKVDFLHYINWVEIYLFVTLPQLRKNLRKKATSNVSKVRNCRLVYHTVLIMLKHQARKRLRQI